MKKSVHKFWSFVLIPILFLSTTAFALSTTNVTNHYDVITSAQWSQMTRAERVAACQLSPTELKNLSTTELVQVVLDYPFFIDVKAYNTNREGFLRVLEESSALQELLRRENSVGVLIDRYEDTKIETTTSILHNDNNFSEQWKLEILLAQPEICNLMDSVQMEKTLELANKKYVQKSANPELYQGISAEFFKSMSENSGISTYAYNAYVQTPKGSRVLVSVWQASDGDYSAAVKQSMRNDVKIAYPNAILLRDATIKYNCHSYAWYSKSSSNIRWMPYPGAFITDGSYPELTKLTTSVGSRIVYYDSTNGTYGTPTHSAVIYSYKDYPKSRRTFVVESKWGSYGLYRHDSFDSPYSYKGINPCDIKYFS